MVPFSRVEQVIEGYAPYKREICVACECKNGPQSWSGNGGLPMHHRCFKIVDPTQNALMYIIQQLFPGEENFERRHIAHRTAIQAVREVCNSPLRAYAELYGRIALTSLFNSVGVEAAMRYRAESQLSKL